MGGEVGSVGHICFVVLFLLISHWWLLLLSVSLAINEVTYEHTDIEAILHHMEAQAKIHWYSRHLPLTRFSYYNNNSNTIKTGCRETLLNVDVTLSMKGVVMVGYSQLFTITSISLRSNIMHSVIVVYFLLVCFCSSWFSFWVFHWCWWWWRLSFVNP